MQDITDITDADSK